MRVFQTVSVQSASKIKSSESLKNFQKSSRRKLRTKVAGFFRDIVRIFSRFLGTVHTIWKTGVRFPVVDSDC